MEFLKKLLPYISITRPKNLLLIGLTQYIIYTFLFNRSIVEVSLKGILLYYFIFDTMLIAAGGYIINDIIDYNTDIINKPQKTYFQNQIPTRYGKMYYYSVLLVGMLLSIYIAIKTNNLPLISLYPLACSILYIYSKKYKSSILAGNIIVSLFVGFVSGIILIAERQVLFSSTIDQWQSEVVQLLIVYIIFSFLVNLIREIIKDIEDIEGDKNNAYLTLPIKYGIDVAKLWATGIAVFAIFVLAVWIYFTNIDLDFRTQVYLILFVAGPLVVILQILTQTTHKRDFSKISTILKWTLLAGLGALILISNSIFT